MSLLSDLQTIAEHCGVPVETGVFSGKAPETYLVITPLSDNFELHADNAPGCETQEARLSIFTKGSYTKLKNALVRALLGADFYIRFLYKGIIIKHNKTEPTYTKTSLFLCEKRRFFMGRTEKGGKVF